MQSLNHNQTIAAHYTNNILLRSRKNLYSHSITLHIKIIMCFLRSQENIQNMPTTLYVMINVLNHCNTTVPHITRLIMCSFRSQRTYVLITIQLLYSLST